jgi:hypothetical protein
VGETVAMIVIGVEAGVFPHHPTTIGSSPWLECVFCDPDALGMADLRRQFDRKREDPALAPFLNLAHPLSFELSRQVMTSSQWLRPVIDELRREFKTPYPLATARPYVWVRSSCWS